MYVQFVRTHPHARATILAQVLKSLCISLHFLVLSNYYQQYPIKNYRGLSPTYRGKRWAYVHFIGDAANYPIIYQ